MPSLNQGLYIDQAIQSVLSQGYRNLELIVMDGGSTDETVRILEKHHRLLKHWESAPDQGPAAALNRGFTFASGAILGVLNADDFYLPGALSRIAHAFTQQPADVISGHGYFARASGELGVASYSDPWNLNRFMYGACVLVQPSTFFRREAFARAGGFRTTGLVCWDMELWADMAMTGSRFGGIHEHLSAFRLHDRSLTGRSDLYLRRRQDARLVMSRVRGGSTSVFDPFFEVFHRAMKLLGHPRHVFAQRRFVHSVLKRWSL